MCGSASAAPASQPTAKEIESLQRFVPSIPLCKSAFDLAVSRLPQAILHHSLRTFIYAKWLAEKESSVYASDEDHLARLFVACELSLSSKPKSEWIGPDQALGLFLDAVSKRVSAGADANTRISSMNPVMVL